MKLRPTLRAATVTLGAAAAVAVFAFFTGSTLVGVPIGPGPPLMGLLIVAAPQPYGLWPG
ncbi:MAG: hypothetical protein M3017_12225 [Actinomycetota bacterium]|nr:hypothetical protein [Actinomycetota bacterium]